MSTKDHWECKRSLKQCAAVARLVKYARVEDEDDVSQSLQVRQYNVFH